MKNKYTEEELHQLRVVQDEKNKKFLKAFLIDEADSKINNKFSDENLDKELEKKQLLEIVSDYWQIDSIKNNVLSNPSDYKKVFPQEYYRQIYRLNGWAVPKTISNKPWVVGKFTNEIIYYRFSSEVLPFLRILNPYKIIGKRTYKHHQYLTKGGRILLSRFIEEAITEMEKHSDWESFKKEYCELYNIPYQLKINF
jgi:hypothetical protein